MPRDPAAKRFRCRAIRHLNFEPIRVTAPAWSTLHPFKSLELRDRTLHPILAGSVAQNVAKLDPRDFMDAVAFAEQI